MSDPEPLFADFYDDKTGERSYRVTAAKDVDHSGEDPTFYLSIFSDPDNSDRRDRFTGAEVSDLFDVVTDAYMEVCEDEASELVAVRLPGKIVDGLIDHQLADDEIAGLLDQLRGALPADRKSMSFDAIMGRVDDRAEAECFNEEDEGYGCDECTETDVTVSETRLAFDHVLTPEELAEIEQLNDEFVAKVTAATERWNS